MTPEDPDYSSGEAEDPNDPNYNPPTEDPSGGFGDENLPSEPSTPTEPTVPVDPWGGDPSGGFGDAGLWAASLNR